LREESIEVLLASYATNYGWTAALSGFHPTILQTWTYDVSVYPVSSWKRLFLAPIVRRALRHADAITTDGQPLADFLCERFSVEHAKVTSLLWGIQVEDFATDPNRRRAVRATLGIYDDAPVVLSHRGVHSRYAPAEVLDALIAYLNDDSSVHALALTLEHGRSKSVQDRLDRLESHPRGHVVDKFLSRDRMADIWSAADVFISVPPRDGISVSALEGMAVGVVPIVTDIESNRALFGRDRARYISDPKSELYEAIRDVISDLPNWRRHVVELNKEWVREHGSVEVAAGRLASLAEALAKRDIHGASKR
jgi:glycosyltransferase involved in cell wall biosynthesis